jgi:uncharacterized glyoxalase superfamily protein PhnB
MERAIPVLPADDLAAAKAFYVDGLGFSITFEASEDGRQGLLGLRRGALEILVDSPMEGHGRQACVTLQVEDADALYREWSAKVKVLRAPKDEEWGARTFDLPDPSGNTIFVSGPLTPAPARLVNSRCVLAVRDLAISTRYWVEALGFSRDPIDAAGWSFLSRGRFRVMLGECADAAPAAELGDHSYIAYWNVEGVDELYTELKGRGATLTSTPADKPWGLREFTLRTPDGHRITCGEEI